VRTAPKIGRFRRDRIGSRVELCCANLPSAVLSLLISSTRPMYADFLSAKLNRLYASLNDLGSLNGPYTVDQQFDSDGMNDAINHILCRRDSISTSL
jgi:hypothetical protein